MKNLILVGLLLFSFNTYSQSKKPKEAFVITDSILKSQISDRLFQYFSISEGSYYSYSDRQGKRRNGKIHRKKLLPNFFSTLNILYHFNYPEIQGVRGDLWLIVDKDFKLVDSLNFDFVPEFIVKNKPSNFISADSALTIANLNSKPNSYKTSILDLTYDKKLKQYIYTASHDLTVVLNATGKDIGEFETIEINATTGNLINISKGNKGIIIR